MSDTFDTDTPKKGLSALTDRLRQVWASLTTDPQHSIFDERRVFHFERIVVEQFAHLFVSDQELATANGALSRRIIPGFLRAMQMMTGPAQFDDFEARGRDIVRRVRNDSGDEFRWDLVYADDETRWLANDLVCHIAGHFDDLAKGRSWFIATLNNHMRPTSAGSDLDEPIDWSFGNMEFQNLMCALYADLKLRLNTEEDIRMLTERYGADAVERLQRLIRVLDARTRMAA